MRRLIIAGICVLLMAVAACSSSSNSPSTADHTYSVLVIGDTSGAAASYTSDYIKGIKAAADVINKSGGIDGKTVVITVENDQNDPTTAVKILQQSAKPDLFYCLCSGEELAVAPIVTEDKILMITTAQDYTVTNAAKYPYIYSLSYQTSAPYTVIKDRLVSEGAKRVGIITTDTQVGNQTWETAKSILTAAGIQVFNQSISLTSLNATSNLEALKRDNVDHLVVSSFTSLTSYIFAARMAVGMGSVPTIGDQAVAATNPEQSIAAADRENVALLTTQVQTSGTITNSAWSTMLSALTPYGKLATGMQQPAETYTGLQVVAAAAKQAGSTSIDAISKALDGLRTQADSPFFFPSSWTIEGLNHTPVFPDSDFSFVNIAPYDSDGQFPASALIK
jgi:branched-chain amino acid transport system substrate-binding protein